MSFSSINDLDMNEIEKDKMTKGYVGRSQEKGNKWSTSKQTQENAINAQREKKNKSNRESHAEANNIASKEEYLQRFINT